MKIMRFVPRFKSKEAMLIEPIPAKKQIPDWYKNGETTYTMDGAEHPGLKTCKPFIDIMISGYFLLTPFDIYVGKTEDGDLKLSWDASDEWDGFIGERTGGIGKTIPIPSGHRTNHLVWSSRWGWKTPKGWSSIVTHPFNRADLPFTTLSGFIDSDNFYGSGNLPFYIKDNFVGTIKAGTPYAQIIPIKRTSWTSFPDYGLISPESIKASNLHREGQAYKNIDWVKKEYE